MKHLSFTFFFSVLSFIIFAQDTIIVPSFHFKSSNRKDTIVQFPNSDHNNYEKILMQYTMRCKNALVSTSTNRNLGCGEWDYSCNTYLTDSTKTDSLKTIAKSLIIGGYSEDFFPLRKNPTFNYTQFQLKEINITKVNNETSVPLSNGSEKLNHPFVSNSNAAKAFYLVKASELPKSLTKINGLEYSLATGNIDAKFLKIRAKLSTENELSPETLNTNDFEELYFQHNTFSASSPKKLYFYQPFDWDGSSNIIFEITYNNVNPIAINTTNGSLENFTASAFTTENDNYWNLNGSNILSLPTDKMNTISNEVSVAFWSYGNPNALPSNTILFNAVDDKNIRQLNVHLPWSNSTIFWDCGGDAAGFDRIEKAATPALFEGKWNHWTFTKNVVTKTMRIYLNGEPWHSATNRIKPINIKKFIIGKDFNGNNPYFGFLDDFAVWNKELTAAEIKKAMYQKIDANYPNYNNLVCFYDFNEQKTDLTAVDKASNPQNGTFSSLPNRIGFEGRQLFKQLSFEKNRPSIKILSGNYESTTKNITALDSIQNAPYQIRTFFVQNNNLVEGKTHYYWLAGDYDILDADGNILGQKTFEEDSLISSEDLVYFRRFPMKYELLSFVTPYGINLDLGKDGKTWFFDMTDLGPILKGNKRMTIELGGQNQEELDIKFLFIKGTPTRNVKDIMQIWPVTYPGYNNILNNNSFEPRTINLPNDVKSAKIKTAITGHGQEGEFIPQTHYINVNGGTREQEWQVWKECANNPIYPQGGTWIYDRAGWCPGMPTDVKELDITNIINTNKTFSVDYGLNTAQGDSRYIVNSQLVSYGAPNFKNDAAVIKIFNPTNYVEYIRTNPNCFNPQIEIQNNGEETLTSLDISYGVIGGKVNTYQWKGNLSLLQKAVVALPSLSLEEWNKGKTFEVKIASPNGKTDQYANNNYFKTAFTTPKQHSSNIVVQMRTNSFPNETSWTLKDASGNILKSRKNALSSNTTYLDTIKNLNGCFQLWFADNGDDGISFWANGDGTGNIGLRDLGKPGPSFQPDFGRDFIYHFFAGNIISTSDPVYKPELVVFPNPTSGEFIAQIEGWVENGSLQLIDCQGNILQNQKITFNGELHRQIPINLSEYPSGIYLVRIQGEKGALVKRVVKI